MNILNDVDKPGSDVEEYVGNLETILTHIMAMIQEMQDKLKNFRGFLKREASLSHMWNKYTNDVEMMDVDEKHGTSFDCEAVTVQLVS